MTAKTDVGDKKRRRVQKQFTFKICVDDDNKPKRKVCAICGRSGIAMFRCKHCDNLVCYMCVIQNDEGCPNCALEKVVFT